MKQIIRKAAAGLLSAVLLGTAIPAEPVFAAEASAAEDTFRQIIHEAWKNRTEDVNISSLRLSFDQVADNYYGMLYTESEWFYVASGFSYVTSAWSGKVTSITCRYNYDTDEIPSMIEEFNTEIDRVTGLVNPAWSDAEKVLFLHDHLGETCEYDLTYNRMDAYSALVGGKTICQGYALAMNLLCRKIGIPCYSITSDDLKHMWNVVQIGGKWYHVDTTFDDSAPEHGT